ncbi:MAG: cell division protein FtsL [Albidovulum sp.]|jgi:hypothetical protein
MRSFFFSLAALAILTLGFWAYRENYRTQGELGELRALQAEVGKLRENLGMLRAEWAYLNRPDRLRELADINFERLRLLPFEAQQFGAVSQVTFPAPPSVFDPNSITNTIATIASLEESQ